MSDEVIEVSFSELAEYLQGLTAGTYRLQINNILSNNIGKSSTSGTLGYIINHNTPPDVYLNLANTRLPNDITDMSGCFRSCTSLTTVPNIPDSVTNMSYCFSECSSLTTVPNIPKSVTNMSYCFSGCTSLVTIDNFHTDILSNPAEADVNLRGAFEGCDSLENIYIKNNFNAPDNASWSIYSVNFNETTFTVKKYGTSLDGDELKVTTLIENEPLNNDPSFALGNYTDELIFDPHKTITENDIKDMIKYHVMMSTLPNTLPPESESFMLFAKDPSKVVTNLRLSKFVDDITLQESDFDDIFS